MILVETFAMRGAALALTPLDFQERRRVLSWLCRVYGIDHAALANT